MQRRPYPRWLIVVVVVLVALFAVTEYVQHPSRLRALEQNSKGQVLLQPTPLVQLEQRERRRRTGSIVVESQKKIPAIAPWQQQAATGVESDGKSESPEAYSMYASKRSIPSYRSTEFYLPTLHVDKNGETVVGDAMPSPPPPLPPPSSPDHGRVSEQRRKPSILVVGSGPAGLALLRALTLLNDGDGSGMPVDVTCYDRQATVGGMWTGDRDFSPMYEGMWINGASFYTEYPSYTYAKHYGKVVPSFFPREIVTDYVAGYAAHSKLQGYITPAMNVTSVKWDPKKRQFSVTSRRMCTRQKCTRQQDLDVRHEYFDFVSIATGSFSEPRSVHHDHFTGKQLHARDWVGPEQYRGKTVVVVGNSDSALDIIALLLKHGATRVYISVRKFYEKGLNEIYDPESRETIEIAELNDTYSEDICERSLKGNREECSSFKGVSVRGEIARADAGTVHFKAGSLAPNVDAIIYATGYRTMGSFDKFVEPALQLRVGSYPELNYPDQLHLDTLLLSNPRLSYMGHNTVLYSFVEYENRAEYVAGIVSGKVAMPRVVTTTSRAGSADDANSIAARIKAGAARLKAWQAWAAHPFLRIQWDACPECEDNSEIYATGIILASQMWRHSAFTSEFGRGAPNSSQVRARAAENKILVLANEAEKRTNLKELFRSCPCTGPNSTFLVEMSEWHDLAHPGSPFAGIWEAAPKAHSQYIHLLDDSAECFFEKSRCTAY